MIHKTRSEEESLDSNYILIRSRGNAPSRTPRTAFMLGFVRQRRKRMPRSRASTWRQNSEADVVKPINQTGPSFHRRSRSLKNKFVTSPRNCHRWCGARSCLGGKRTSFFEALVEAPPYSTA